VLTLAQAWSACKRSQPGPRVRARAGAAPGAYELVLRVKDELGGRELEVREPFEIG
jgi:hypothetical protein